MNNDIFYALTSQDFWHFLGFWVVVILAIGFCAALFYTSSENDDMSASYDFMKESAHE